MRGDMIETAASSDHEAMVQRQAMLPPWSPEIRERVRRELRASPLRAMRLDAAVADKVLVALISHLGGDAIVLPQDVTVETSGVVQTTLLREERKARATNIGHYCRKCRGLGTRRHHAMCKKRGRCHRIGMNLSREERLVERYAHGNAEMERYFAERDGDLRPSLDRVAKALLGIEA